MSATETTECVIVMSSDEYGNETFDYESEDEANAGLDRLIESITGRPVPDNYAASGELMAKDGVERTLYLIERERYDEMMERTGDDPDLDDLSSVADVEIQIEARSRRTRWTPGR